MWVHLCSPVSDDIWRAGGRSCFSRWITTFSVTFARWRLSSSHNAWLLPGFMLLRLPTNPLSWKCLQASPTFYRSFTHHHVWLWFVTLAQDTWLKLETENLSFPLKQTFELLLPREGEKGNNTTQPFKVLCSFSKGNKSLAIQYVTRGVKLSLWVNISMCIFLLVSFSSMMLVDGGSVQTQWLSQDMYSMKTVVQRTVPAMLIHWALFISRDGFLKPNQKYAPIVQLYVHR